MTKKYSKIDRKGLTALNNNLQICFQQLESVSDDYQESIDKDQFDQVANLFGASVMSISDSIERIKIILDELDKE